MRQWIEERTLTVDELCEMGLKDRNVWVFWYCGISLLGTSSGQKTKQKAWI
jgi:hypothetical protein